MLLNTKCERCNEPTKHVVGFWDGENGKSGFVHDCENEKCEVRQLIKVTETKAMQERFRIQNLNSRKRMYAGYIAALRKDAKISMMEMSKIAGAVRLNTVHMSMKEGHLMRRLTENVKSIC